MQYLDGYESIWIGLSQKHDQKNWLIDTKITVVARNIEWWVYCSVIANLFV